MCEIITLFAQNAIMQLEHPVGLAGQLFIVGNDDQAGLLLSDALNQQPEDH